MVKVAENKIVDLDLLPGTEEDKLKAYADKVGAKSTEDLPPEVREKIHSLSQGATTTGQDVLNTVGGGVKGVVDTAGDTVGTLGGGLSDTVTGVVGGLGNVTRSAGGTAQAGLSSSKEDGETAADTAADTAGQTAGSAQDVAGKAGETATAMAGGAKDTVGGTAEKGGKQLGL